MKICPMCHDEYRDDITMCLECAVPLEAVADGTRLATKAKIQTEQVDLMTAVKISEGALEGCREIEGLLKNAKIASILIPSEGKFAICINPERIEAFATLMKNRFEDMVAREHSADWTHHEVNLDGGDVTCPACTFVGPLVDGACADCGLMLGVE